MITGAVLRAVGEEVITFEEAGIPDEKKKKKKKKKEEKLSRVINTMTCNAEIYIQFLRLFQTGVSQLGDNIQAQCFGS